jgi:hypothetical protein
MATNAVTVASKAQIIPEFAQGNLRKAVFSVDCTALTLFVAGNTDNVTVADIPAGTTILGGFINVTSAATNATGTCTVSLIAGGASGTVMTAASTAKTAGSVAGSMANTLTVVAADTLVLSFATATASNTVNPKVQVTVFFAA